MKLYKFRSLGDDVSVGRAMDIVQKGQFRCSRFWELNDPMEGVYRLQTTSPCVRQVFDVKADRLLCSFSGAKTISNSLMWGYYANGFKGLAVEIETADDEPIKPVTYTPDVVCPDTTQPVDAQVDAILCNKLSPWKHEREYRYLVRGHERFQKIGRITAVVLGVPYPKSILPEDRGERLQHLTEYRQRVERVETIARQSQCRVHVAYVRSGKVEIAFDATTEGWGA